jgi:carboxymethylenebutenolidase
MAHMRTLMATLDRRTAECDTKAMLDFVAARPAAHARRIGALGYCMSGPFVVWAAAAYPESLACIACIHGANMMTAADDSPHRWAAKLKCESYFACAETDIWAPREHIDALEATLKAAKVPHRIEWYPGTEHGFVFPQRAVYRREGAERHWERLFALFRHRLPPP